MQTKSAAIDDVAAPPRIRPEHMRERTLSIVAGAPKGYTAETWPIAIAHARGKLEDPGSRWHKIYNARTRFEAIEEVHDLRQITLRSGSDSTILDVVKGGGGEPLTQAQADASKKLVSIFSRMATSDRIIVERLIDGYVLAQAVKQAEGASYVNSTYARVRTALDALIDARGKAAGSGWKFDLAIS